ncbi:MAG: hypothetical protein MZW92_64895 [Comamonadaceae bacterium]|nr:hypothetical protein [Comamonadaceae bacterium]
MTGGERRDGTRRLRRCEIHPCRRHLDLLPARRQVLRPHRRPRRQARRFRDPLHLRLDPAAAVPDRRCPAAGSRLWASPGMRGPKEQGGQRHAPARYAAASHHHHAEGKNSACQQGAGPL